MRDRETAREGERQRDCERQRERQRQGVRERERKRENQINPCSRHDLMMMVIVDNKPYSCYGSFLMGIKKSLLHSKFI